MSQAFIERVSLGNLYVARIDAAEDLHGAISRIADLKSERRMLILSAVGALCDVSLRNLAPGAELPIEGSHWLPLTEPGPCEIDLPVLHEPARFRSPQVDARKGLECGREQPVVCNPQLVRRVHRAQVQRPRALVQGEQRGVPVV